MALTPIYWLASYPKSGNTWLRALIANYLADSDHPANINELGYYIPYESYRLWFDLAFQMDSSLLTNAEIDQLRPEYHRLFAKTNTGVIVLKTHQCFSRFANGDPLFPADATGGIIYIARNPLDVVVSFANHNRQTIDQTILDMNDAGYSLANFPNVRSTALHEHLGTWSQHISTWLDQTALPQLTIRYEDLSADTTTVFAQVLEFLGLEMDSARLEKAIRFSSIGEMKKQEQDLSFIEKPLGVESFFRKGKVGDWRSSLTSEQVAQIVRDHGAMMQRLNYPLPLIDAPKD
ncbi:MAG: sulfotransferase domain-containing protein [Anaerolineae bacterium]